MEVCVADAKQAKKKRLYVEYPNASGGLSRVPKEPTFYERTKESFKNMDERAQINVARREQAGKLRDEEDED